MTIRFYILPIIVFNGMRGPKYFQFGPKGGDKSPGINCWWSMKDYGLIDQCVICADISDADHTAVADNPDVMAIPVNLDNNLTAGAVTTATNYLESVNIPADWVSVLDTYRSVLRSVVGLFMFMQRVTAIRGVPIDWVSINLQTRWRDIPTNWQNAMIQAATELGFSTDGVTNTVRLRAILKAMADRWTEPIKFKNDEIVL